MKGNRRPISPTAISVVTGTAAYRGGRDPQEVMSSDDLEQLLKDCRHGLQRIGRIVKQISVFAHQSPHDLDRDDLAGHDEEWILATRGE